MNRGDKGTRQGQHLGGFIGGGGAYHGSSVVVLDGLGLAAALAAALGRTQRGRKAGGRRRHAKGAVSRQDTHGSRAAAALQAFLQIAATTRQRRLNGHLGTFNGEIR